MLKEVVGCLWRVLPSVVPVLFDPGWKQYVVGEVVVAFPVGRCRSLFVQGRRMQRWVVVVVVVVVEVVPAREGSSR